MRDVTVVDPIGRDVLRPSEWLPVGREYHASLRTPYQVTVREGSREVASAVVRAVDGTRNMVRVDTITFGGAPSEEGLAALLYATLREARIVGRTLADIESGVHRDQVATVLGTSVVRGDIVRQRVDYGMYRAYSSSGSEWQAAFADAFPGEVVRAIEHRIEDFFARGTWAGSIRQGALSRRQYVATLFNLHSYVRYTTRLLGDCIGMSDDRRLRAHYIEHLKGEINHELIIERDLTNLGEDVEYVTKSHQPSPATLAFMCIQESIVAFYRDPALFLACPVAAESFAAYVQQDILEGLKRSVASWGLDDPADVVHFIKSHSGFDGGPEGHWNLCVNMIRDYVRTEEQMQRFSSTLNAAMAALAGNYESCAEEYDEPEIGRRSAGPN